MEYQLQPTLLRVSTATPRTVLGPATSTDNAVARFDGTSGASVQDSGVIISDANAVTGIASISGLTTDLAVAEGGTGVSTLADGGLVVGNAAAAVEVVAAGATTDILVGGGALTNPVWTAATGSGSPVRATSPSLVTPALGTPASGVLTNCTGGPWALKAGDIFTGNVTIDKSEPTINIDGSGASRSHLIFKRQATLKWDIFTQGESADELHFNDGASSLFNMARTTGNLTLAGLLTLTAGQIAFPATQSASAGANTLDDYEEGTWTPSVGGSATYTTQTGRYTKIGRVVNLFMILTINVIGTGSTTTVSGLPFTVAAGIAGSMAVGDWAASATAVTCLMGKILAGTTTLELRSVTAAAVNTALNDIFGSNARVEGAGVYDV